MAEIPQQRYTPAGPGGSGLSQKLEGFKNKFLTVAYNENVKTGIRRAAEVEFTDRDGDGVTDAPEFKNNNFFSSVHNKAYNKALEAGYVASLDNDIRGGLTRIELEHSSNAEGYKAAVQGFRQSIRKEVDPRVRRIALQSLDQRYARDYVKVLTRDREKQRAKSFQETTFVADSLLEEARGFSRGDDPIAAAQTLEHYNAVKDQQVEAGLITPVEAIVQKRKANALLHEDNLRGDVKRLVEAGEAEKALTSLSNFYHKNIPGLNVTEKDAINNRIVAEYHQSISIQRQLENAELADFEMSQKDAEADIYRCINDGTCGGEMVDDYLRDRKITLEGARRLNNQLNNKGKGVNDFDLINQLQEDMEERDVEAQIKAAGGTDLQEVWVNRLLKENRDAREARKAAAEEAAEAAKDKKVAKQVAYRSHPHLKDEREYLNTMFRTYNEYGIPQVTDREVKANAMNYLMRRGEELLNAGKEVRGLADQAITLFRKVPSEERYDTSLGSWEDPAGAMEKLRALAMEKKGSLDPVWFRRQAAKILDRKNQVEAKQWLDSKRPPRL